MYDRYLSVLTLGTSVNNDADHQHPYMSAIIERNTCAALASLGCSGIIRCSDSSRPVGKG
mgnify:CR=1 FL=1